MFSQCYRYSPLTVHLVRLTPHERFTFRANTADNGIGTIYNYGCIAPVGDTDWEHIVEHQGWRARSVWGGWKDPNSTSGTATFEAGPVGAEWICLAENGTGPRTVQDMVLNGSFVLPAGWGVVVANGNATLEGRVGTMCNYFRPRETDTVMTGAADLLLVR